MIATKRERVLCAINHQEPDRVPLDLGGLDVTGISTIAYRKLRSFLGLKDETIRIVCVIQQLADVAEEVLQAVGADVRSVFIRGHYKPGKLSDGSFCEIPETWNPQTRSDGSEVVTNVCGDINYLRPSAGHFFEPVYHPLGNCETLADLERHEDDILNMGMSFNLPKDINKAFGEASDVAKNLRGETDYLLVSANFEGKTFAGAQGLRGWEQFLIDLYERPVFAEALMDMIVDVYCERFDRYWNALGQYIDVMQVSDDLGNQTAPIISPEMYKKMIKPYHQKLYSYIKKKAGVPIVMHTDGSVYRLIPDLIEVGVGFLNPVQASAADMDTKRLKKEFGDVLGFWGGGCDTQSVLPHGTRQEIRDEVKRRIDDLAPGGGFVFSQVHNILPDVPPENIMTMYEAVWEFGKY